MSFSGNYYKINCNESGYRFITIVSYINKKNDKGAHVQFISIDDKGNLVFTKTLKFPKYSKNKEIIHFGNSWASSEELRIDESDLKIFVSITKSTPLPKPLLGKNVMGIYHYLPFVQCKHYVANIFSHVKGEIAFKDRSFVMNDSLMYSENSKGHSFPKKYLWYHFDQFKECDDTYLFFAHANPKWLVVRKNTYIGFFYHKGEYFALGELSGAKLLKKSIGAQMAEIKIKTKQIELNVQIEQGHENLQLVGPSTKGMIRPIKEYINSLAIIKLKTIDNKSFTLNGFNGTVEQEIEINN